MMAVTPVDSTDINTHPTFDKENCTCKGIPLYGKVKVMDNSFADFDVRITNGFPDLSIQHRISIPCRIPLSLFGCV